MSKRQKFNYEPFEEELEVLLARDIITDWRFQTAGQYSVNDKSLYLYPKSKKCFNPTTEEWAEYKDLESFLNLVLKNY